MNKSSRSWDPTKAFYEMRNNIVRPLPSWQRSGVVSQRLWLRRLTLIKRIHVSFLFLACFSIEISTCQNCSYDIKIIVIAKNLRKLCQSL
eukprot:UN14529